MRRVKDGKVYEVVEVYTYPEDMPAKDKIPANAQITEELIEVSQEQIDREIEEEAREVAIKKIADKEKLAIKERKKRVGEIL